MSMMHERLRYYGGSGFATTRNHNEKNHVCICCNIGMSSMDKSTNKNNYCSLLCYDCKRALIKHKKGIRLIKNEVKILECMIHAIR